MLPKVTKSRTIALAVAAVAFCLTASAAEVNENKRVLKIMTRNMDAGTDLNLIFANYPDIPGGVSATLAQGDLHRYSVARPTPGGRDTYQPARLHRSSGGDRMAHGSLWSYRGALRPITVASGCAGGS